MDAKDLKKIVQIMNENDLVEVEIEQEGKRLRVRKAEAAGVPQIVAAPAAPAADAAASAAPEETKEADGLHTIMAPMVGTFYRGPAPDQDAYIEVGQRVSPDTTVGILEAMKVMNEIKADCSGEIVKVSVQNAEAVEYGQALFMVKPG